jgi:hypothetical protein
LEEEKAHGLADVAGLTSAEITRRDLEAKEKAGRAYTTTLLKPAKVKAGKSASCAPPMNPTRPSLEEEDWEVDSDLLPSTAPPRRFHPLRYL